MERVGERADKARIKRTLEELLRRQAAAQAKTLLKILILILNPESKSRIINCFGSTGEASEGLRAPAGALGGGAPAAQRGPGAPQVLAGHAQSLLRARLAGRGRP